MERAVLAREADRLGLQVSDADLARELRTGTFSQYLFPDGKYIGDEAYLNFVDPLLPDLGGELRKGVQS